MPFIIIIRYTLRYVAATYAAKDTPKKFLKVIVISGDEAVRDLPETEFALS
jgi:hypothetical protein